MKPFILAGLLSVALASVVILSGRDLPSPDRDAGRLADDAVVLAR